MKGGKGFQRRIAKQTTLLRSKPLTRVELRRVFERADDLGGFADAAENREAGQTQAHQQGAGGFGNHGEGCR